MADACKPDTNDVPADTKKKLHWLEIGYFSSQIVLAVIGIWALTVYHGQLKVMRGQLDEMKRSGEQSTEQMWSAIGNMNWMARSMDSTQQQARESLQATIGNFHTEQRAWIELDQPKATLSPPADTPPGMTLFRFPMYIRNVGKTSAFDIKIRFYNPIESADSVHNKPDIERLQLPVAVLREKEVENVHRAFGPKTKVGTYEGFAMPGVLAPGIRSNAPFIMLAETPTENRRGRPEGLNYFTVLVGRVEYSDTFSHPHWMKFCYYVWDDEGDIQTCPYGNDEDRFAESQK
jgi:hypothetical protein